LGKRKERERELNLLEKAACAERVVGKVAGDVTGVGQLMAADNGWW
jgi:hypothetical protein